MKHQRELLGKLLIPGGIADYYPQKPYSYLQLFIKKQKMLYNNI